MPALLTSASSWPKVCSTLAIAAPTAPASETSQASASVSSPVDLGHRAQEQLALDVEQRHAPALGQKFLGRRKPDAARGSGDESDFLLG